jgi:hypothetical protein
LNIEEILKKKDIKTNITGGIKKRSSSLANTKYNSIERRKKSKINKPMVSAIILQLPTIIKKTLPFLTKTKTSR